MAIETRVQFFNSFLGLHEGIHSTIMPDAFSSSGSQNVWMDKYARVRKILGYAKQNSAAVTTDTGGSATKLVGLFPYRSTSGGSITRQTIGVFDDGNDEIEVYSSTDQGANWTFRKDLGSGAVGNIPDFAQFGDDLFITDGNGNVQVWDGSSISDAGGTQSPQPTASGTGTGSLAGTYQYKLVSVESDGSRHPGSAASSAVQLDDEKGSLSWTQDSDTNVVGYEVYRTTATGKIFYFIDFVDGRTTASYTDNLSDLRALENRVLEEHGDAPTSGVYYVEPFKQRMWFGRTDTDPRRVYYSDPGDPDSVWADNNFIDFSDPTTQGDFVTGMVGNFEDTLVVFLERAVFRVSGTGEIIGNIVDWSRDKTNANIGSVSHKAIARVPAGAKYADQFGDNQTTDVVTLAYFTPLGDIRLFDGRNDIVISNPVRDTVDGFNYAQRSKVFALHDSARKQITWFFPEDSTKSENSQGVTWNYRFGIWYIWTPMPFASGTEVETSSDSSTLLVGESDTTKGGFCYELWSGNSFDGSSINSIWFSKVLMGVNESGIPIIHKRKRWRWVDLVMTSTSTVTVTVEWFEGFASDFATATGSTTVQPSSGTLRTSDGNRILSSDGNVLVVSSDSLHERILMKPYFRSETMRLKFSEDSTNPAWGVESFSLGYQPLEGLRNKAS